MKNLFTLTLVLSALVLSSFADAESDFDRQQREAYNSQINAQNNAEMQGPTALERYSQRVREINSQPAPKLSQPKVRCVRDNLYPDEVICTQE